MTETVLEIIEHLDFSVEVPCEWCEVRGAEPLPATVYLRRPACPCNPGGKVFPACDGWLSRHVYTDNLRHAPCETLYAASELVVVGRA